MFMSISKYNIFTDVHDRGKQPKIDLKARLIKYL
jgi:hypothetical protein